MRRVSWGKQQRGTPGVRPVLKAFLPEAAEDHLGAALIRPVDLRYSQKLRFRQVRNEKGGTA